tara:strand:- start:758 stop:1948 length:1191 start_codon:yes stop_codon:yes gene_type:complete
MFSNQEILEIINRKSSLFDKDIETHNDELKKIVSSSKFLIIGGAGSIGRQVTKEILKRKPKTIHIVDISENNLVELIRDLRSSNSITTQLETFSIDTMSNSFDLLTKNYKYDYVLNLSAIKHVRAERDPYTILRMIEVNILSTLKSLEKTKDFSNKFFCVSTDKASNPVSLMGASKRVMELFLIDHQPEIEISSARFANVAFSDGSLLEGFINRFNKKQPFAAPLDIKRYFITPMESGELCLMSAIFGKDKDIFFPKFREDFQLTSFTDIAENYLLKKGYEPLYCSTEEEAREKVPLIDKQKKWPCFFFKSDTSGEKSFEEFFTSEENPDLKSFQSIGVVKSKFDTESELLKKFLERFNEISHREKLDKKIFVDLFNTVLPNFTHLETNKNLDQKM